jgi:hypothetical protein
VGQLQQAVETARGFIDRLHGSSVSWSNRRLRIDEEWFATRQF